MGYSEPVPIVTMLRRIQSGDLVLPAIQREFVWKAPQIERLFDSVLRGYPIGSFLAWTVAPETTQSFRFYGFLKDYHEKNNPYCAVLDLPPHHRVTAILDGQQRLTALNIGLRGSFATKLPGAWWSNNSAFPARRLHLNLLEAATENDLGMTYDFRFLTEKQAETPKDGSAHWFPVPRIFELKGFAGLMNELAARELGNHVFAGEVLSKLYESVHSTPALYLYEESDQDVEKVLDIFIRVNSGGTVLSYSDLLMSIATAQWKDRDAREEIRSLVKSLNGIGQGFRLTKDTVLKTGLVLTGVAEIGFKVRNFNSANMGALEKDWDEIAKALTVAAGLLADFGLSAASLTANSVIIPIAHYVHRRGLDDSYRTRVADRADREAIRRWVLRSLMKQGIWGSGLDTLLRDLRAAIETHGEQGFPAEQIESRMAARGKSLSFSREEIDDLLDLSFGSGRLFPVMAMLFPHVDTRNLHHIDHIFPRSRMTRSRLESGGLSVADAEEVVRRRDLLPNLQLLEGAENVSKSATMPAAWVASTHTGDGYGAYLDRHLVPTLPTDFIGFLDWFDRRSALLAERLRAVLQVTDGELLEDLDHAAARDDELAHSTGD